MIRGALLLIACVVLAVACAPTGGATPPPPAPTLVLSTPLTFPTISIETARAVLASRLSQAGLMLEPTNRRYRPSEPSVLLQAQHSVFRLADADPNQGWLIIYDLGSAEAAAAAGDEFAGYLGTFGRTNFPADAQFTINQVGQALVFNWWSRSRAADPAPLEAAFAAISAVGQRYEVRP